MQPQLPIAVDADTGVWTTDGLPMLYVPRHFFVNNHVAVEQALGRDAYAQILYQAGHKSAWYWCDKEAVTHGLAGLDVFRHYLARLSQRGWGLFDFLEVDAARASARVRLRHSSMVLGRPGDTGRLCYMFSGWFAGAMDWVSDQAGNPLRAHSTESQCQCEDPSHTHCVFTVAARSASGVT
jgi:hypothetical protein